MPLSSSNFKVFHANYRLCFCVCFPYNTNATSTRKSNLNNTNLESQTTKMGHRNVSTENKIQPNPPKDLNSNPNLYERHMLTNLKPVTTVCRLFGLFPYEIVPETETTSELTLQHKRKGWFIYSLIIWIISTAYVSFQVVSLGISISKGNNIFQVVAQSLWFDAAVVPYAVSVFMFFKGSHVIGLFEEWCIIEKEIDRLFCPIKTKRNIRNFQGIYLFLAFLSISFCGYHAIKLPNSPVYPLSYLNMSDYNKLHYGSYAVFQIIMIGWLWAGNVALEGICCLFATVMVQCMDTLVYELDSNFSSHKPSSHKKHSYAVGLDLKIEMDNGNTESRNSHKSESHMTTSDLNLNKMTNVCTMEKEELLVTVVRKLQMVASLQSKINCVLGPLILLDMGQLVIMSCALTFLPVKFSESLDFDSAIAFVGNGITLFARLIIVITCLGKVFSKGQDVNMALAKGMTTHVLTSSTQNQLLAYLSVYSASPISFTAWGFFPITRGTLLAAFSLISTYTVIFFQVQ